MERNLIIMQFVEALPKDLPGYFSKRNDAVIKWEDGIKPRSSQKNLFCMNQELN